MHGFSFLQARKAKKSNLIFYKFEKAKKEFTVVVQLLYPPPQSESTLLDMCPGVGNFHMQKNFVGRVELRGGGKVTEQPR